MRLGLQSSHSLTGESPIPGSSCDIGRTHFLTGCWAEDLGSLLAFAWSLSQFLPHRPLQRATGCIRERPETDRQTDGGRREGRGGLRGKVLQCNLEEMPCHFCCVLLVRSTTLGPTHRRENLLKVWNPRWGRYLAAI